MSKNSISLKRAVKRKPTTSVVGSNAAKQPQQQIVEEVVECSLS